MRALTRASLAGIPNDKPSAFSLLKDLCPHAGMRQPCTNFSKPHAHAMSVCCRSALYNARLYAHTISMPVHPLSPQVLMSMSEHTAFMALLYELICA